ncbi:MAG: hypothetical protein K2J47_08330 [Ruminococcus sp.]|nr:hypothetical protein [Ruminococcus sp.]
METTAIITEAETVNTVIIDLETVTTSTTVSTVDLSRLSEIDVDMLNASTYLVSAFVIGFFFFSVCKGVYRFFNMFF